MRARRVVRGVALLVVVAGVTVAAPSLAYASPPDLQAVLTIGNNAILSSPNDSVTAGSILGTNWHDDGTLSNAGTVGATGGTVHVTPNAGSAPADVTGDLPVGSPGITNSLYGGGTEIVDYDADRLLSAGGAAPGLSHKTLTLHITPADPAFGTGARAMMVYVNGDVGTLVASNYTLDAGPVGATGEPRSTGGFQVSWPNIVAHTTYTVVIGFDLNNATAATYAYKPYVNFHSSSTGSSGTASATSVSLSDPAGGVFAFSVNELSNWTSTIYNVIGVGMDSQATPAGPPALLDVAAKVSRNYTVVPDSSDTVSSAPQTLHRFFTAGLYSAQGTVHGAAISLGARTMTYSPPLPTPFSVGPQDVLVGSDLAWSRSAPDETGSIGFDASRTLSTSTLPAGGGNVVVTLTITPSDARADGLGFDLDCSNGAGAGTVVPGSVVWPAVTHGESVNNEQVFGNLVLVSIFNVATSVPYVLQVTCHAPLAGTYKPWAMVELGHATHYAEVDATSTSITDPVQGGTVTFSSSDAVAWGGYLIDSWATYFDAVSPTPYTLGLDSSSFSVAAGGAVTPHATVTVPLGFPSPISVSLSGDDGAGNPVTTPLGFYQSGSWNNLNVAGVLDENLPIGVASSVAPGTYHLLITSTALSGPGSTRTPVTIVVTAALPQADLGVFRNSFVTVGPSDTVSSAPQLLGRGWGARIYNGGSSTLPGTQLSLDTTSVAFTPSLTGGATTGAGTDLAPGNSLWLNPFSSATASSALGSIGFDASRSLSPAAIPAGGGVQTVTLHVTPQDARWHDGWIDLQVNATNFGGFPGASIVPGSFSCPAPVGSEQVQSYSDLAGGTCRLGGGVIGHEYTMSLQIQVPNSAAVPQTYKPWASVAGRNSVSSAYGVQGTSVAVNDPMLGGTITAHSSSDAIWSYGLMENGYAYFNPVLPTTWSIDLNPSTLSISAGDSAATQVTIHEPSASSVNLGLSGAPGGGPPPTGFSVACCGTYSGHDGDVVNLPIRVDGTVAPGTYNLYVTGMVSGRPGVYAQPITIVVGPAVGQLLVYDDRGQHVDLPAGVDSIAAGDVNPGWKLWGLSLYNSGSTDIANAHLSVDGSTLPWSPAVSFPVNANTALLAPGSSLFLSALDRYEANSSSVPGQPISTGFDVQRSVSPQVIPVGGATQTVSFTVTARDPRLAGKSIFIDSWTDWAIANTHIVAGSIVLPSPTNGENFSQYVQDTSLFLNVGNVQLNMPYTFSYQVLVPNITPGSITYDPGVLVSGSWSNLLPSTLGTSRTFADSELGGSITASSSDTVRFTPMISEFHEVGLSGRAQNSIPLDHFLVQLTTPPVNAGAPTGVRVTALDSANHRVMSYPGSVDLYDTGGNLLTASLTWSAGIGTGTVTFADPYANQILEADDSSGINLLASGFSTRFQVYGSLDHFRVSVSPTTGSTSIPATIKVTALDSVGHTIPYNGAGLSLTDTQSAPGLTLPSTLAWSAGVGTGVATAASGIHNDSIVATAGGSTGTSNAFSRSGAASRFVVTVTPTSLPVTGTATVKVTAYDAVGNIATAYAGPPTLTDSAGVLASVGAWTGTGTLTTTATFSGPAKGDKMTAVDGAVTSPPSYAFNVIGDATRLAVSVLPANVPVAGSATVKVTAYDGAGNVATGYAGTPTFTDSAAVGVFGSAAAVSGVSTSSVSFTGPAKADKVTATDGALTSPASNAFNVIGDATRLAVSVLPANVPVAGSATVKVTAYDGAGNVATGYGGPLTLTDSAAVAVFGPAVAVSGVSTSSVSFLAPAKADKVTATDASLTSPASNPFNVIGPATRLAVSVLPVNVPVTGSATVKVTAYDVAGNVATGYGGPLTLTDSAAVGVFGPAVAVSGVSTSSVSFGGAAKADKITATDGSLTSPVSNAFNVIGPAVSFKVVVAPATVARTALVTVTATALDAAGNVATGYAGTVTYSDNLALPAVTPGPYDQVNTNGVIVAHVGFTRGPVTSLKIVVTDTVSTSLTGLSNAFRIT